MGPPQVTSSMTPLCGGTHLLSQWLPISRYACCHDPSAVPDPALHNAVELYNSHHFSGAKLSQLHLLLVLLPMLADLLQACFLAAS